MVKQVFWTNQMRLSHFNRDSSNKLLQWRTMHDQEQTNRYKKAGTPFLLGRHSSLDCSEERLQLIRIIVAYPIDEEGRCAVHSTAYPAQEILVHAIGMHVLSHLALERLLIEIECNSILD